MNEDGDPSPHRKEVAHLCTERFRIVTVFVVCLGILAALFAVGLERQSITAVTVETSDQQWSLTAEVPKENLVEDNFAVIHVVLRNIGKTPVTIIPGIRVHSKVELLDREMPRGSPPLMVRIPPSETMLAGEEKSWWLQVPDPGWKLPAGVLKARVSIEAPYSIGRETKMLALKTGALVLRVSPVPKHEQTNWRSLCAIRESLASNMAAKPSHLDSLFAARPRSVYLPLAVYYFQLSCGVAASSEEARTANQPTQLRSAATEAGLRYLRDPASRNDIEWVVDQIAAATAGSAYSVKDYDTAMAAAERCSPENRKYHLARARKAVETGTNEDEVSLARQREGMKKGEIIYNANKEKVARITKERLALEARYREEWKQVDQRVRDLGGPITEFEQHLMRPQEEINEQVHQAQLRKEVHDGMGDLTTDKVKTNGALWFELTTAELQKVVEHREANKKRLGLSQDELKKKRSAPASDRDMEAIKLEGELIRSGGRFTEEEKKLLRSDKEKAAEIERAYQAGELHDDFSPLTSYSTDKLETRISYQMKLNLDDLKKVKEFREKKKKDSGKK